MKNKGIQKQLEEIAERICNDYCKFPEVYSSQFKEPDEASDRLADEKCVNCPIYLNF